MEFLLLLSAAAFVLGTVNGDCNNDVRDSCKAMDEANLLSETDNCRKINAVRPCVLRTAGCSEESANAAATEIDNDLNFKCKDDPKWEKEGRCITREAKCEDEYIATTKGMTNKDDICKAIGVFQECTKSECAVAVIDRNIAKFAKKAAIQRCENIAVSVCTDPLKYEKCIGAFDSAKVDLDLGKDTETQCKLASAVEHCLSSKAGCQTETTRRAIKNMLDTLDCSEYVDLCDHLAAETCETRHSNPDNCEKLKEFRSCLRGNHTCPADRVPHILRVIMIEKNIDCADVDTCELKKLESCNVDVGQEKKTNDEKCQLFKDYQKCLERANCNKKYMDSKIAATKGELGNPCGASSILASIGLTLLLAAFTGQWK